MIKKKIKLLDAGIRLFSLFAVLLMRPSLKNCNRLCEPVSANRPVVLFVWNKMKQWNAPARLQGWEGSQTEIINDALGGWMGDGLTDRGTCNWRLFLLTKLVLTCTC